MRLILNRVKDDKPPKHKHAVLFEAGGIAALLRITQRLKLLDLINEVSPRRKQVIHRWALCHLGRPKPCP